MTSLSVPYAKMNGIGNSILVMDLREAGISLSPAAAALIARRDDLAYDQLMAIEVPRKADTEAFVRIFNADGSRAEACGNGTRCVAWVLMRAKDSTHLRIETDAGELACERLGASEFSVDMGPPRLAWRDIPLAGPIAETADVMLPPRDDIPGDMNHFSAVNMGNPHAVFFVEDVGAVPLHKVGPLIEHHPLFPERTNVSFAEVVTPTHLALRVWERSAGATLACGSAACATLVAAVRMGHAERQALVSLPGGDLTIHWRETDGHVVMSGAVELEHEGTLSRQLWESAA